MGRGETMAQVPRTGRSARQARAKTQEGLMRRRRMLLSELCAERRYRGACVPLDVSDWLDRTTLGVGQEIVLSIAEKRWTAVLEIEEAIRRLRSGSYGICKNCGDKITQARLKARPSTCYCIHCQEEEERLGAEEALEPPAWDMIEEPSSTALEGGIRGSVRFQ